MDNIIVTSILIIGAITTAAVVVFSITSNTNRDSQITARIQGSQSQEMRTKIRIASAATDPQGTLLRVCARNIGSVDIEPIDGIDVVLERMDNTWGTVIPFAANTVISWSLVSAPDSGSADSIWEADETVQFVSSDNMYFLIGRTAANSDRGAEDDTEYLRFTVFDFR